MILIFLYKIAVRIVEHVNYFFLENITYFLLSVALFRLCSVPLSDYWCFSI